MSGEEARENLLALLKKLSFEKRSVVLSSGKTSDFFIDCKKTLLTAEGHALVARVLLPRVALTSARAVAGVELGGCPLASAVAMASSEGAALDALYVRKARKEHGSQKRIEGGDRLAPGAEIVLLEDVVTTGGSTLQAAEALRESGFRLVLVIALVDRLEGGADAIAAAGLPFDAIYTRRDFF